MALDKETQRTINEFARIIANPASGMFIEKGKEPSAPTVPVSYCKALKSYDASLFTTFISIILLPFAEEILRAGLTTKNNSKISSLEQIGAGVIIILMSLVGFYLSRRAWAPSFCFHRGSSHEGTPDERQPLSPTAATDAVAASSTNLRKIPLLTNGAAAPTVAQMTIASYPQSRGGYGATGIRPGSYAQPPESDADYVALDGNPVKQSQGCKDWVTAHRPKK